MTNSFVESKESICLVTSSCCWAIERLYRSLTSPMSICNMNCDSEQSTSGKACGAKMMASASRAALTIWRPEKDVPGNGQKTYSLVRVGQTNMFASSKAAPGNSESRFFVSKWNAYHSIHVRDTKIYRKLCYLSANFLGFWNDGLDIFGVYCLVLSFLDDDIRGCQLFQNFCDKDIFF